MFAKIVASIVLAASSFAIMPSTVDVNNDIVNEDTTDVRDFSFIEYGDITNPANNYNDLRYSVDKCYDINETQKQIDECVNYLVLGANRVDA